MTAIILLVAQITSSPLYGKNNSEKKDYVVVTKENSLSAIKKIPAAYRAGTKKLEGRILKARLTEFQAFELRKNRNIIAASGNAGLDKPDYPSGYKNVLSVGSVSSKAKRSSFSNKSDVLAPGQGIRANGAMGKTMITNGTSMAVPHVVGIASLLWEKNKKKTNTDIRNAIERSIHRGIIDYNYALKVLNKTNTSKQEKNNSIINTYDNSADETIYKGTWNTSEHNSFINNYLDKGSYYAVMMKQASYDADHLSDKIFGMNNHPEFHGYFQNVNHRKEDVNILSCYRMLIKIANEYGKGKDYRSISSSAGGGYYKEDEAKNDFRIANITYYYYIQVKELNSTRDEAVKKHYEQINITVNKGKVVRE